MRPRVRALQLLERTLSHLAHHLNSSPLCGLYTVSATLKLTEPHCRRSSGFTIEERDSFTSVILGGGLTDCFRRQHPGVVAYSYYGYRMNMRSKGKGWRLDYTLVSMRSLTWRLCIIFVQSNALQLSAFTPNSGISLA